MNITMTALKAHLIPFMRNITAFETAVVGLMVFWRWAWRTLLFGGIIFFISYAVTGLLNVRDPLAMAGLVANGLMVPLWLYIFDRCGKIVARKRYQQEITRFLGWSIAWRETLYRVILLAVSFAVYTGVSALVPAGERILFVGFAVCGACVIIVTYGFATRRTLEIYANISMAQKKSES